MTTNPEVYFIDDEVDLRLANEQTLELAGFDVKVFEKAEDVLKLIDDQTSGIVISDIRLPGIDGLALLQ
ncbi:MAG: response regulator, partial [Candidatus Thiodiazotropha sp.]